MTEQEPIKRLEDGMSIKTSAIIKKFIKTLPCTWKAKRGAKKLLKTFPEFSQPLQLPDEHEIFAWIQGLCLTPHRRPGTPEGHQAEQWVFQKLMEVGLENVTMDPIPITVWQASNWSLTVDSLEIPSFFVLNTGFTGEKGITAPLIYVGTGTKKDFKNVDVSGKIVVADVPFPYIKTGILVKLLKFLGASYLVSDPEKSLNRKSGQFLNFVRRNFIGGTTAENASMDDVYWQAFKKGARGLCLILKDQPSNSNSHYGPYDGIMKPIPALWIGKHDGNTLREKAMSHTNATLVLRGTQHPGVMHNIWGVLPGKSEEIVLVTSHHDAPFQGAIEDGAGVAQVLAQVQTWAKVPVEQRERTIVFVVDAGHFYGSRGAFKFAQDHPDLMKKARILITLEHLCGKEVEEDEQIYKENGQLALTVMFTSNQPLPIATVINALRKKPAKKTLPIPSNLFAPVPVSDAGGYVAESGVPVISWIGCPYYLLDEHDTLDMVEKTELVPFCETITELIKPFMSENF